MQTDATTEQVTTLLHVVGGFGPTMLRKFDRFLTICNKCQHCCSSTQTDATCWAQQCCILLANNVASVCMGLNYRSIHMWPGIFKNGDFFSPQIQLPSTHNLHFWAPKTKMFKYALQGGYF